MYLKYIEFEDLGVLCFQYVMLCFRYVDGYVWIMIMLMVMCGL